MVNIWFISDYIWSTYGLTEDNDDDGDDDDYDGDDDDDTPLNFAVSNFQTNK
jgi:hypothetical protein